MNKMMNGLLADLVVASRKAQGLHWYVKGADFPMAHARLEEVYNELLMMIDEVAEVMLMSNMEPIVTMEEFASNASIKEQKGAFITSKEAFAVVAADYASLMKTVAEAKKKAEEDGADLVGIKCDALTEMLAKTHWMLTQR